MFINYLGLIVSGLFIVILFGLGSWVFGCNFLIIWFDYYYLLLVGEFELVSVMVFDFGVYLMVIGVILLILVNLGKFIISECFKVGDD